MANFTTHIAVGTVVSGAAATLTLAADVIAPESLDRGDAGRRRRQRAAGYRFEGFTAEPGAVRRAGGVPVVLRAVSVAAKYSIAEMWIAWLGTLVVVRYGVHKAVSSLLLPSRDLALDRGGRVLLVPDGGDLPSPARVSTRAWRGSRAASCSSAS